MIKNIIHRYVKELAEEAQSQIQVQSADIEAVEFPCTEDDYVKLAVEATLMEDPIEALNAVLEAHAWVMTRESSKEYGNIVANELVKFCNKHSSWQDLNITRNPWNKNESIVKREQNEKLVNMIIGETNG